MDAEKIQHIERDKDQCIDFAVGGGRERPVQFVHSLGRAPSRCRREAHKVGAVGLTFDDKIVRHLPPTCVGRAGEPEQIAVQLEDEIRRQLHVFVPLMNELKHIAVARDLTLGAVPRLGLFVPPDENLNSRARQCDAFEAV